MHGRDDLRPDETFVAAAVAAYQERTLEARCHASIHPKPQPDPLSSVVGFLQSYNLPEQGFANGARAASHAA